MNSIKILSDRLLEELYVLIPDMHKSARRSLSILASTVLETKTCNLMEWAVHIPHNSHVIDYRYRWIERFMNCRTVNEDDCMMQLSYDLLTSKVERNERIIVCMDQTDINNTFGVLMLSIRIGNRGMPLFWRTYKTKGNIGTEEQLNLMNLLYESLPENANILFLADKFFGTHAVIKQCQEYGWSYRVRLKKNNCINNKDNIFSTRDLMNIEDYGIEDVDLFQKSLNTNIGYLHEEGHKDPWIIAMDATPTRETILEYGQRWGIESMFSDLKTRGFGLEDTQLKDPKRINRLILILSVAMYYAVSVGLQCKIQKKLSKHEKDDEIPLFRL